MGKRKYPVLSKNGNKYQVEVFYGETLYNTGINVYISKKVKNIFGRDKFKVVKHYNDWAYSEREVFENHSYVSLVKHYIEKYEESISDEIAYEKRLKEIGKEFDEWSGQC